MKIIHFPVRRTFQNFWDKFVARLMTQNARHIGREKYDFNQNTKHGDYFLLSTSRYIRLASRWQDDIGVRDHESSFFSRPLAWHWECWWRSERPPCSRIDDRAWLFEHFFEFFGGVFELSKVFLKHKKCFVWKSYFSRLMCLALCVINLAANLSQNFWKVHRTGKWMIFVFIHRSFWWDAYQRSYSQRLDTFGYHLVLLFQSEMKGWTDSQKSVVFWTFQSNDVYLKWLRSLNINHLLRWDCCLLLSESGGKPEFC